MTDTPTPRSPRRRTIPVATLRPGRYTTAGDFDCGPAMVALLA